VDNHSYLTVEGWDEPEVEIGVISRRPFLTGAEGEAGKAFEQIRVATERRSEKIGGFDDAPRSPWLSLFHTPFAPDHLHHAEETTLGVTVDCIVHVRATRGCSASGPWLRVGERRVGDIEVNSHTGDMIVLLPDPGLTRSTPNQDGHSPPICGQRAQAIPVGRHSFTPASSSRPDLLAWVAAASPSRTVRVRTFGKTEGPDSDMVHEEKLGLVSFTEPRL